MSENLAFNFDQDYSKTPLFCAGKPGLFDTVNKQYPEIWSLYKQMKSLDWDENEVSYSSCIADFEKCDKSTYDMMIKTLAFQWEADSIVSRLAPVVSPFVSSSELWAAWQRVSENECVTPEHEVLTPTGWKSISEITLDDSVAQWEYGTGEVTFVKPTALIKKQYEGEMYKFTSDRSNVNQIVTPNHRMPLVYPYWDSKNGEYKHASDVNYHGGNGFPLSGKLPHGKGMTNKEKMWVAVQADGSMASDKYTGAKTGKLHYKFGLKKKRKQERLARLCESAGYELRKHDTVSEREGGSSLYYVHLPVSEYNWGAKSFDWVNFENISYEWAIDFLNEVAQWDGTITKSGNIRYISSNKECIEVVRTVAHLAGKRAHLTVIPERKDILMPSGSVSDTSEVYQLYITERSYIPGNTVRKEKVNYSGDVYCITVPSSYFMVRLDNVISVTGNCLHSITYSEIVRSSFKDPSVIMSEILKVRESFDRLDIIGKVMHDTYKISHEYALGNVSDDVAYEQVFLFVCALLCLERIQFVSSFAVTFAIADTGLFEPIGAIVQKIAQDEFEIHVELDKVVIRNELKTERGLAVFNKNKELINKMIDEVVLSEMVWSDYLFSEGRSLVGMNKQLLKAWACYNAKDVYNFLGLKPLDQTIKLPTSNPLPFMEDWLNISKKQPSPQEQDVTQYKTNVLVSDDDGIELEI